MKLFMLSALLIVAVNAQTDPIMSAILNEHSAYFNALDMNNDNIIENSEIVEYYNRVDSNNNNCITYEEFARSRQDLTDTPEDIIRASYLFYDEVAGSEPANGCESRRDMFDLLGLSDLNDDGDISLNEFQAATMIYATAVYEALIAMQSITAVTN